MRIGAHYLGDSRCEFRVWAPNAEAVTVKIVSPQERILAMQQQEGGYWQVTDEEIQPGTQYFYQLNKGESRPDPASNLQALDVHGPSQVIDHSFTWNDSSWSGIPLESMIIYELHVGTFTPEGTFEAIISRLKDLQDLGVNAIEIMPVAQFPGDRNWGYDGVYPFAVQNSYGGPEGLKRLVDACHQQGIAVILDVV
ncbi:MAG: malto-oligosyltrehalose trehalohydrolase, partial [Microcoleus sp. SIO2G3]|nr:malto-oligosyltrehalose trehalohydrolase [Microcoleus sp. SIO2G3]